MMPRALICLVLALAVMQLLVLRRLRNAVQECVDAPPTVRYVAPSVQVDPFMPRLGYPRPAPTATREIL